MAHAQKPYFVFRQNGWVKLNWLGCQFSRLLAAEVCASAVVMLDTPCSEVVWRVLATHSIRQFPLHFPSCASPCAITFQLNSTINISACNYFYFILFLLFLLPTLDCSTSLCTLSKAVIFLRTIILIFFMQFITTGPIWQCDVKVHNT